MRAVLPGRRCLIAAAAKLPAAPLSRSCWCWRPLPVRWPDSPSSTPSILPQIDDLEHFRPSTTTDLYDRKGRIIGSFALERREVVGYDGFAPVLRQAVISIEDKNFESHWGINVFRVAGACMARHPQPRARTRCIDPHHAVGAQPFSFVRPHAMRKIQEAYLAIQIERTFTKQQIFTLYGNQIYLGSGMYGFEAASEYYFSKHAKDLT